MTRMLWPDLTADQVHARVAEAWDCTSGWPIPRFTMRCPVCGAHDVGLKDWRFFERRGATIPWRCDVSAKCCTCSHVITFGVAVTEELYRSHTRRRYPWRYVREQVQAEPLAAVSPGGPAGASPAPR